MNLAEFDRIRIRYGKVASWAVWDPDPAHQHDTSLIDNNLLELKTSVVMVGLNISAKLNSDWSNFRGGRHDRKMKYAFNFSSYRGAYMTDIIKGNDSVEVNSAKVASRIQDRSIDINEHIAKFEEEMHMVGADSNSLFLVFGKVAQRLFSQFLAKQFPQFVPCPHYSRRGTDADWVEDIWTLLEDHTCKQFIDDHLRFRRTTEMVKQLNDLKAKSTTSRAA